MIITTLTSIAGFLSLLSMNTDSIVDLAVFAGVGILLAGVATWYVLPLVLSRNIDILPKKAPKFHIPFGDFLKKAWGIPSFIIVGVLITLTIIFTGSIHNEFDMLSFYRSYTVVAKNTQKLEVVNGGSIPLYLVYQNDDLITLDAMDDIHQVTSDLLDQGLVNKVIDPYRLLEIVYQNQASTDIPNDLVMQGLYNQIKTSDLPIDSMIDDSTHTMRILLFSSNMENQTLDAIESVINDADLNVHVTGAQYLLKDLNVSINTMQLNSILLAIGIVFLMLWASLRDFKLAFLSILPISITVASIYAVLGMTGINLNITTVIIFSISIGVGIDYAVHFSSVYKMHYQATQKPKESVMDAFNDVSKPIIANALGISLGLSVLMLSPLSIHLHVSILMWVGMIVSVFVTLTFLPTILRMRKK